MLREGKNTRLSDIREWDTFEVEQESVNSIVNLAIHATADERRTHTHNNFELSTGVFRYSPFLVG